MLKESGNPLKNIPQVREGGTDTQVSHILTPLVKTPNQNLGLKCYLYVQQNQTEAFSIHPQGMTQNAPNNPALYYASFHPQPTHFKKQIKRVYPSPFPEGVLCQEYALESLLLILLLQCVKILI